MQLQSLSYILSSTVLESIACFFQNNTTLTNPCNSVPFIWLIIFCYLRAKTLKVNDLTIFNATEKENESDCEVSQLLLLAIVHWTCCSVTYLLEMNGLSAETSFWFPGTQVGLINPTLGVSN